MSHRPDRRQFLKRTADRYRMETGAAAPRTTDWDRFTAAGAGSTSGYAVAGGGFFARVTHG